MNTFKYIFCVIFLILTSTSPAYAQLDLNCCGDDMNTAAYWRCQTYREAEIYDWNPDEGLDYNKQNVVNVYNYYGQLYKMDSLRFYWAALARIVGKDFYGGFRDVHILRRDIEDNRLSINEVYEIFSGITNQDFVDLPTLFKVTLLEGIEVALEFERPEDLVDDLWFVERTFLKMQKQIFDDIAWQHLAYANGGIDLINNIFTNDPAIHNMLTVTQIQNLISAWEDIDFGSSEGTVNHEKVAEGARKIAYHEQWIVIQDDYDEIWEYSRFTKALLTFVSWISFSPVENGSLFFTSVIIDNIDLGLFDIYTADPTANIANAKDRWDWITGDMLPAINDNLLNNSPKTMECLNEIAEISDTNNSMTYYLRVALQNGTGSPLIYNLLENSTFLDFPLNEDDKRVEPEDCIDCEGTLNGLAIQGTICYQDPINQTGEGTWLNNGATCSCETPIPQIQTYKGNNTTQDIVFTENANLIKEINLKDDWSDNLPIIGGHLPFFDRDNQIRSLNLYKVPPGRTFRFYDNPDGNRQDDWVEIRTKQYIEELAINTLQQSINNNQLRMIYHRNDNGSNALDGEVSRYEALEKPSGPTIDFHQGYDGTENLVCSVEMYPGQIIDFTKDDRYNNDKAKSVILYDVPQNMVIRIYDNSEGNTNDDYLEIKALQDFEEEVVDNLETSSYTNANVKVTYYENDNLNEKVSRFEVSCEGQCDIPQKCEIDTLNIQINEISSVGCDGANGALSVGVLSGGIPPFKYRWSQLDNNNNLSFVGLAKSISNLDAGLYVVEVSDERDCSVSERFELTANLDIKSQISPATCGEADGKISLTIEGGTSPYNYLWSHQVNSGPSSINVSAGLYTVTVIGSGGCIATETFEVKEKNDIKLAFVKKNSSSCDADDGWAEVRISGLKGEPMILWSTDETTARIEGLAPDMYTVDVVDDANNCHAEASVIISQPEVNISGGGLRMVLPGGVPSATLTANISDCSSCTYMWSTNEMGSSITVYESGTYSVTVNDGNGCTYQNSEWVSFYELIAIGGDNDGNCGFWGNITKTLLGFNGCPPWWDFPVLHAFDPNDIAGNIGYEEDRWVSVNERLGYVIRFENDPEFATGPAQTVTIRHPLDLNVDPYTIRLGNFGFGSFNFSVPPNSVTYNGRLDVRDSLDVFVDVIAGIDVQNNEAFWILKSIDPNTGQTPIDAALGFLEVTDTTVTRFNDTIPKASEGFVSYSVMPKSTSITGDTVLAQASIIFDQNAPIETNIWKNTIDAFYPVSNMNPATYDEGYVILTWTGQDDPGGVGVQNYDIYYSVNGGEFELLASDISGNTYTFEGEPGNTYEFFTIARDWVNNVEPMKDGGDIAVLFEGVTLPACTIMDIPLINAINDGVCVTSLADWQHQINDLGEVLLSVNPMGNNLGDISVNLYVDDAPIGYDGSTFLLQRHYRVITENTPQSGMMLRLYLTEQELTNLMNITSVGTLDDLVVIKYSGVGEDDVYDPTQDGTLEILAPNEIGTDFNADYIEIMVDGFGEFWIAHSLLPIQLIDFYAVNKPREVELKWQTANEQNSDYYDVQRSRNGTDFTPIGKVQAAGNSSNVQNYTHIDSNPINGTSYYRLQQFDLDGNNSYSKVVSVTRRNNVIVYPNPVKDELILDWYSEQTGDVQCQIYDISGKLVIDINWQIPDGQHHKTKTLNMESFPAGVYLIKLTGETPTRFVKK